VAALVASHRPYMTYAHVGDSRVYLVRSDAVTQLTRDDSWANLHAADEPEDEGLRSQMKNVLTKALGAREEVDFAVAEHELASGDIVLLCSDGLTNMLPDDRIQEIVLARSEDLEGACQELVSEANDRGGRDNISVILLRYAL
jgi:PPM family protein phosphatase